MRWEHSENKFGITGDDLDKAFSDDLIRTLMDELHYTKPKTSSSDGSVIRIQMHDPHTSKESAFRFNIGSFLDSSSVLVNPCGSTNVIFDLTGNMTPELAEAVNISEREGNGVRKRTLSERYQMLRSNGIGMEYAGTQDPVLENNLRMIDSRLPEILAEMLKLHYVEGISDIGEQIGILSERNPLKFREPREYPYYELKIKKMLTSYALGMRPSSPWKEDEQAEGYITVNEDGEVLCYHPRNRSDLEDYLIGYTKLDTPSVTRHGFSDVYKTVDGKYRLKLNLQIRFK